MWKPFLLVAGREGSALADIVQFFFVLVANKSLVANKLFMANRHDLISFATSTASFSSVL